MDAHEYLENIKKFQKSLLEYLDEEGDDDSYRSVCQIFNDQIKRNNKYEIKETLQLILNMIDNHHRSTSFITNMQSLLVKYKDKIKQTLTNFELFEFFQDNKRVLHFLFKESIITMDQQIFDVINETKYWNSNYIKFFLIESKPFISTQLYDELKEGLGIENIEEFEEKRKIGENDSKICHLIRNDLVEEFIQYVNRKNISLTSKINQSIYETNPFLKDKNPTLIEYAAFFGSIEIFNYIRLNNIELDPSLWLYTIHGRNPQIIHLLEEFDVVPSDKNYHECLFESLKCYNNDVAVYIRDNLCEGEININHICFLCRNYEFFPEDFNEINTIYDLCNYNYVFLLEKVMKDVTININEKVENKTPLKIAVDNKFMDIVSILMNHDGIEIGEDSFSNCDLLTRFEIPECATFIGKNAFNHCKNLSYISIPDSVTCIEIGAFECCENLKEVKISPNSSLKKIDDRCFYGCKSLSALMIPKSVESIGKSSFEGCESLIDFELPQSITVVDDCFFKNCKSLKQIIVPHLVTLIGNRSFCNCSSMTQISFSSSVTEIKDGAFEGCSLLAQILIPSSVHSIGCHSFSNCSSIKEISIPSSITVIKASTFKKCTSLEKVAIPPSVTAIEKEAFLCCSSLLSVSLPSSITVIGNHAFCGCSKITEITIPPLLSVVDEFLFEGCKSLKNVVIPSSVKIIGQFAFEGCVSLDKIEIPDSVTEIKESAFLGCILLKEIKVPPLEIIQPYTFKGCTSLEKVVFPSNTLKSIENSAFKDCIKLKEVVIPDSVTFIGSFAFKGCPDDMHIELPPSVTQFGEIPFPGNRDDIPDAAKQSRYGSCSFDPNKDEQTNDSKCQIF